MLFKVYLWVQVLYKYNINSVSLSQIFLTTIKTYIILFINLFYVVKNNKTNTKASCKSIVQRNLIQKFRHLYLLTLSKRDVNCSCLSLTRKSV